MKKQFLPTAPARPTYTRALHTPLYMQYVTGLAVLLPRVPLLESVLDHGWCRLVPRLLAIADHDAREKVLHTMRSLLEPCRTDFAGHVPTLRRLRAEYARLSEMELGGSSEMESPLEGSPPPPSSSSDELLYFTDLLRTVDDVINDVTATKDEL